MSSLHRHLSFRTRHLLKFRTRLSTYMDSCFFYLLFLSRLDCLKTVFNVSTMFNSSKFVFWCKCFKSSCSSCNLFRASIELLVSTLLSLLHQINLSNVNLRPLSCSAAKPRADIRKVALIKWTYLLSMLVPSIRQRLYHAEENACMRIDLEGRNLVFSLTKWPRTNTKFEIRG